MLSEIIFHQIIISPHKPVTNCSNKPNLAHFTHEKQNYLISKKNIQAAQTVSLVPHS